MFALLLLRAPQVIQQKTPVRVLQRRAPLVRERTIHSLTPRPVPGAPHYLVLDLRTAAGTYIKEFIHSDLGRTRPSLGDILSCVQGDGGEGGPILCDILQLDVLSVRMSFLDNTDSEAAAFSSLAPG